MFPEVTQASCFFCVLEPLLDRIDTASPNSEAGSWFFCGRKWIDPTDPDGRDKLDIHHFNLCVLFPAFAEACPRARFIDAIAAVSESWSRPMRAVAETARCRTIADFAPDSPPMGSYAG